MFLCAWKKIPAIATILLNIVVGSAMYFIQVKAVLFKQLATLMNEGYHSHTGNVEVDTLLTRGGIESMLPTIALFILALSLGGVLIETNLIATVLNRLSPLFQKTVSLIFFTLTASIGVNIFIGEQFLSVILPGNALKEVYAKKISPRRFKSDIGRWWHSDQLSSSMGDCRKFCGNHFWCSGSDVCPVCFF